MKEPYILFKNIKKARTSSGLSQKELAKRLGVSDKTVSAYETGRAIPPTPTLSKIAEITNVTMSEILGESENNTQKTYNNIARQLDNIENRLTNLEQVLIKLMKER